MTTNHTPGPWKVFDSMVDGDTYGIDGADGYAVVYYGYRGAEDGIPKRADACLIAAAPELLEALESCVIWNGKRGPDDNLLPIDRQPGEIAKAMRAIAKAKGEQQ